LRRVEGEIARTHRLAARTEPKSSERARLEQRLGRLFDKYQAPRAIAARRWIRRNWAGGEYERLRHHFGPMTARSAGQFELKYFRLIEAYRAIKFMAEAREKKSDSLLPRWPESRWNAGITEPFGVDAEGKVRFANDGIRQVLEGVEADRIRACPTCHHFFWARRSDQPCCSRPCANSRRVRRWREDYLKKHKVQRYAKAEAASGRKRATKTRGKSRPEK
jgi:hypothetical protein